jgi:hypothetical protein
MKASAALGASGLAAATLALAQALVQVEIDGSAGAFAFAGPPPAGRIGFYVDGRLLLERSPAQEFGRLQLALAPGRHLFRFAVELEDPRGGAATLEDDCAGEFELQDATRLRPRLQFVLARPAPGKIADYLSCTLLPAP